jgi:Secretion system C-terminal sorting domain
MKRYKLLPILCLLLILGIHTSAQVSQRKYVAANGGTIAKSNIFSSQSVVGQMASGSFSAGIFSGTIGYLDYGDSVFAQVNTNNFYLTLNVYPNPNNGSFTLSIVPPRVSKVTILLINVLGQILVKREEMLNLGPNTFAFSNIPKGVLFIKTIVDNSQVGTHKVVVE